jgi:hypothetical protein
MHIIYWPVLGDFLKPYLSWPFFLLHLTAKGIYGLNMKVTCDLVHGKTAPPWCLPIRALQPVGGIFCKIRQ